MTRILPPCLNTLIKDQKREKKARGDGSGNDGKKEWEGREKDEEGKEEKALCKIWVESTGRFHCRTFTSSVAELARLERGKAAAIFFLRHQQVTDELDWKIRIIKRSLPDPGPKLK